MRSTDQGKQNEITKAIVNFVAMNLQPLSVVESKTFRNILEEAEPLYLMPSRKYLSTKLLTYHYNKLMQASTNILTSKVRLMMDIWTNRQMRSFLGVTGHFVKDFRLQSFMLSCRRFRGSHTGENIMHLCEEIVTLFDITGNEDRVITDNASNMIFHLLDINDGSI